MKKTNGACPECGHQFFLYEPQQRLYGSPIRTCKKCGGNYLDTRYHELAIEPLPKRETAKWPCFVLMVVGAFFLYRGNHLWTMKQLNTPDFMQKVLPVMVLLLGAACIVGGIVELIAVLTGRKAEKMETLRKESEARLNNPTYAQELQAAGYEVPPQYINGGFDQ